MCGIGQQINHKVLGKAYRQFIVDNGLEESLEQIHINRGRIRMR